MGGESESESVREREREDGNDTHFRRLSLSLSPSTKGTGWDRLLIREEISADTSLEVNGMMQEEEEKNFFLF